MDRRTLLRGVGGLGLLTALAGCAPSYPSLRLRIATAGQTGTYFKLGTALATVWNEELHPGALPEVLTTPGSVNNLKLLAQRSVEVVFSQLDAASEPFDRASTQFDPRSATNPVSPRALARIYDDVVQVVVPRDSPIRSLTQLRGRRVSVGDTGSGVLYTVPRLLKAAGLAMTADLTAVNLNITNSVKAMRAGQIDAFFWLSGLPQTEINDLAKVFPVRLVDMADIQERVQQLYSVYALRQVPAGTYGADNKPMTTLYVRNLLLVRSEMPDAVAHDLVKAMFDRQPQIALATANALTIDTRRGIGTEPVPLHPGAERWFRETKGSD